MAYSSPSVQPLVDSGRFSIGQSIINIYINVIFLSSYLNTAVVQITIPYSKNSATASN